MFPAIPLLFAALVGQPVLEPVAVSEGASALIDVGRYEVRYQRGTEPWQTMPIGWTGNFLPTVGIAVVQQADDTLFLHCPWMNGTGPLEVRYRLALPAVRPITLRFEYAMAERNTEKSDGVTFGARVEPTGEEVPGHVLLEQHTKSTAWTPVEADLTAFAGRTVDLVLRVHPGAANDSSFDFSLFRHLGLQVGPGVSGSLADRLALLRARRAGYAAHAPALRELAARADQGVVPSTGGAYANRVAESGEGWVLRAGGEGYTLEYRLDRGADLGSLTASYDGCEPIPLNGGFGFTLANGTLGAWTPGEVSTDGVTLVATGTVSGDGLAARVTQRIRPIGKALAIELESPDPTIASFTAPQVGAAAWKRDVLIPYLPVGRITYLTDQSLFVGSVLDWTTSEASRHGPAVAHYEPLSDGSRIRLRETAAVSVSPFLGEVLPNVPNPASPYREELARRVVIDDWTGNFRVLREALETYARYGVEDLFVQAHVWQNGGYDAKLPDVLPANAAMGGDEEMLALSQAAKRLGYRFGVHENYVDIYPDAASWDEKLVARDAQGELVKAWYNEGTRIQSYGYRADAIVPTAERFTPEVHQRYGTTGSFIDVHSAVPPWFHVEFTAGEEIAGRFHPVWEAHQALWRLFREVHDGPVMGEGSNHALWSGLLDGAEAQVAEGEHHRILPDFDLLKVHPLILNHGMGYYERWLAEGYDAGMQSRMALIRADKYRTQEILYAHAGFVGATWVTEPRLAVKEAWMMRPLQTAYGATPVTNIEYLVAGEWVDSSIALALEATGVVRVTYENGLTVTINQSPEPVEEEGRTIARYGFHARGGGIREAYTAEVEGRVVDFVEDDAAIVVDARGQAYHPGVVSGVLFPARLLAPRIEPVGPRQFRITYRWRVERPVDPATLEGCGIFVHYVGKGVPAENEGITFQGDHGPSVPFGQWQLGQVIEDGPHTVTVPAEAPEADYQALVGVWGPGGRKTLLGAEVGAQRYQVAVVHVAADGTVTVTEPEPPADTLSPLAVYEERYNREGAVVDFGALVTSGAARLVREGTDGFRVYPLPQEVAFPLAVRPAALGLEGERFAMDLLDGDGAVLRSVSLPVEGGLLALPIGEPGVCSLRVRR